MSYILEALRRAETERERKRRVPGLHAQPMPAPPEEPGVRRSKAWLWVVVGVSAGVLLPLLWRSWGSDPTGEETAGAHSTVAGSVTPQGGVGASAPVTTAEPPPANPPVANAPAAPERPHAPQARPTAPKAGATARAGAATPPDATTRPPNTTTAAASAATADGASPGRAAKPAPPAAAAAPEPRLRTLAELPDELRRGVPQLAFGGSVYSETPAQRMVIFNGQVLREGDAVTEELVLEQIRARSAVMRLRGQRFEVAF